MLDGANYSYWKARMIAFLKSMDRKCWKVILTRWEPPSTKDSAVTAIKEANDITTMKLDELFSSLSTFELSFDDHGKKKKEGITFQGVCEETSKHDQKPTSEENLVEAVTLLSRRFTKFKNTFYKKSVGNGT
ncbi:gag-pol polyprotein [Cucumis melo var. makuwa]|uniref:Gag-pol polyprotein n=1 Tax=Cucumis melo var. makuwa TaxID=1194695 RepID=A0A5A7TK89_CUCMM|nr:gag-pol polyprotein [Cucumis melo var. makuwa]TYK17907.1 gag-pol polyprotein [Cucumis melo var. makuwa]